MQLSIYSYTKPDAYLRDVLSHLKKENCAYSVRLFAYEAKIKSHSSLSDMINGKRKISTAIMINIASFLKLSTDEKKYFEYMINLQKAKKIESMREYTEEMNNLRKKHNFNIVVLKDEAIQSSPLFAFLLDMLSIAPLKNDLRLIKALLRDKFGLSEIEVMLNNLCTRGFVFLVNNYWVKGCEDFFYSEHGKTNIALRRYHQSLCALAHDAINDLPLSEKEFNGISLNVDKNRIPEVKEYLRNLVKEMVVKFNQPEAIDAVTCQFTTHFFTVSEPIINQNIRKELAQ